MKAKRKRTRKPDSPANSDVGGADTTSASSLGIGEIGVSALLRSVAEPSDPLGTPEKCRAVARDLFDAIASRQSATIARKIFRAFTKPAKLPSKKARDVLAWNTFELLRDHFGVESTTAARDLRRLYPDDFKHLDERSLARRLQRLKKRPPT
jgi:hypothetical protein